jgi:peptidoglycan/LPS O-acetylase OafA/YrhL
MAAMALRSPVGWISLAAGFPLRLGRKRAAGGSIARSAAASNPAGRPVRRTLTRTRQPAAAEGYYVRRLTCLDGLRGVLAAYVMMSHLAPFASLPRWVAGPLSHGGAAVDVFFVLSGMVITRSLDRFGWRAGPFLRARARRIVPVFLVVFALAVAIQPLGLPFARMPWIGPTSPARFIWSGGWPSHWAVELLAHLTMTHGLFPRAVLPYAWVSFLGAAWSLSTEWQFYALLAALAALRGPRARHGLPWLILGLAVAGTLWSVAAPPGWRFSRAFLGNKAQYFALGIAGADLGEQPGGARRHAAVLAAVLGLCVLRGGVGQAAAPLVWTLCLLAERGRPRALAPLAAVLRLPWLQWLGAVSYPLYLVNEPVQKLLGLALARLAGGDAAVFTALWLPAAAGLPLAAAWLLHRTIELPRGPATPRAAVVVAAPGD